MGRQEHAHGIDQDHVRVRGTRRARVTRVARFRYRELLGRSAMRGCQPGTVALQRAMTSAGSRLVINFFGLVDTGRRRADHRPLQDVRDQT